MYTVSGKKEIKCTVVIFGKQYLENNAKLLVPTLSTSPIFDATLLCKIKCLYFTALQYENGRVQEGNCVRQVHHI